MAITTFLVKGFLTTSSKEKSVIYNGQEAEKAFHIINNYGDAAQVEIHIYSNGSLVDVIHQYTHKQKGEYKDMAYIIQDTTLGYLIVKDTKEEAEKAFNQAVDSVYDSKEISFGGFKTVMTLTEVNKKTNYSKTIKGKEIISDDEETD